MDATTERLDPPNPLPHIVLPAAQHTVSYGTSTHGCVHALYKNGISLIDEPGAMTGQLAIMATMVLSFGVLFLWSDVAADRLGLGFLFTLAITVASLGMLRTDLIGHRHEPVLFDRAAHKVHLFVSERPRWWQLWKWRAGSRVDSFDWACIRAEVVEITQVGGAGVPRKDYALTLAVLEAPGSTKVRARFGVGLGNPWGTEPVLMLWEHLRRFMKGEGPHLAPGDKVYVARTETLWQGLGFMQPLLMPGARGWITGSDFSGAWWFTAPVAVFFLVALPFTAACGLIRWLAIKARREPRWPAEILASVGAPLDVTVPQHGKMQRRKVRRAGKAEGG